MKTKTQDYYDGYRLGILDFQRGFEPRFTHDSDFAEGYYQGYCDSITKDVE